MSKQNINDQIKRFDEKYEKLNNEIYSSIMSEFKRVKTFKKIIKKINYSFQDLLEFLGFNDIENIINGEYISIHKTLVKVVGYEKNNTIEYSQVSKTFILTHIISWKDDKVIYKNIIKNEHPFTKDSLKGMLNKRFFKKEFKKKSCVIENFLKNRKVKYENNSYR